MNKLLTKIVGVGLGLTLAAGVGVGVAVNNNSSRKVEAAAGDTTTVSLDFHSSFYGMSTTQGDQTLTGDGATYGFQFKKGTGTGAKASATTPSNTTYAFFGKTGVYFRNTSAPSNSYISSIGWKYSSGVSTNVQLSLSYSDNALSAPTSSAITSFGKASANGVVSLSPTDTSNSYFLIYVTNAYNCQWASFTVTWTEKSSGSATVTDVSVTGNSSKTSYTTVDSWSNAGLTANVTMSDSSTYTGSIAWAYSPDLTPVAAVIANSNEEVTGYSLTATATAGGQSGSKTTTGVSVSLAEVADGLAAIPNSGDEVDGVIVKGIISYIDSIDTSTYHNATYFISDDGSRTDELEVYRGKGLNNADFTNSNDIMVGDTVLVYGNLKFYNGTTKEFLQGNYLLDLDRPASSDPSITITEANFSMTVGDSDVTLHATANNIPTGGSVKWVSGTPATATIVEATGVLHAVAAGTTVITAKIVDSSDNTVASNSITVSVFENAISNGDTFIIKADYSSTIYYLTDVTSAHIGTTSTTQSEAMVFTAIEGETSGQFQFKNGSNYLSYSGSSNNVYTTTDSEAASTFWTALDNGTSVVVESVNVSGRKLQFNYNSGNPRFACYSSSQTAVSIEKVTAPEVDEVYVYGDSTADAEGALSITKEFLYEVSYVADEGTSAVTVSVLNSSSTTDGASVTTAPSAGTFSVTFTASDTYTITVTSVEDNTKSDSTTIVVSNIYVAVLTDYDLYSGTTVSGNPVLTEGDYIIYYNGKALKNSISSNRAQYEEVTPTNDTISTDNQNIVWHIGLDGDYYTFYNALEGKYLASTNSNNQAKLETSVTDNSRWTVEISNGTFEFVNKARDAAGSNNKYLRENTTYGFAVYASGTGGALSLYKKAYDAVGYSNILLNYLGGVCDATNGNTVVADLTATWAILSAEYSGLDSSVKVDIDDDSSSATVLSALSAYDYVVGKYNKTQGVTAINDFMNRNPDPVGASTKIIPTVDMNNTTVLTVIVITAVLGFTTIGGYFLLRKKKEER